MSTLNNVAPGQEVIIKKITGPSLLRHDLAELGLEIGARVKVLASVMYERYQVRLDQSTVILCCGEASKIFVRAKEAAQGASAEENDHKVPALKTLLQIPNLSPGAEAVVVRLIGGTRAKEELRRKGLKEGTSFTVLEKVGPSRENEGGCVLLKAGGYTFRLGAGLAARVFVQNPA